jgi:hypothetical protein
VQVELVAWRLRVCLGRRRCRCRCRANSLNWELGDPLDVSLAEFLRTDYIVSMHGQSCLGMRAASRSVPRDFVEECPV